MPVIARDILSRARILLQDHESTRWSLAEMVGWFNDGQRDIVLNKPNACSRTVTVPLDVGTLQAVPAGYLSIIRAIRNIDNPAQPQLGGKTVYMSPRDVLDATYVDWHSAAPHRRVKCVVYDIADTKSFYVYPPNDGTGNIEAVLARMPTDIAIPVTVADQLDIAAYTSPLGLDDIYANAILDYGIYRAYMKDAAVAGNAQRATFYYQQYAAALGLKFQAEMVANPNAVMTAPAPSEPARGPG